MYDYVIVGAGSAGCVLAGRLSEDPDTRVLLLEAGRDERRKEVSIPAAWVKLFRSGCDWGYRTEPEPGLGGRTLYVPRGRMLGGSSSLNAMVYVRGHRTDFDGWAESGSPGWGYDEVLPYFRRSEDNSRGASAFHGAGGPLSVSDPGAPNPLSAAFVEAAAAAGIPLNPDFNGAELEGAGFLQCTVRAGRRWSAADAFLRPALGRRNLTVETGARATRVVVERGRAAGVRYLRDGEERFAPAEREVVVACGAFDSPRLLLLSGIGPADELRRHGVAVAQDLPGVGRNLQEHAAVPLLVRAARPLSLLSAESLPSVLRYLLFRRGMLASNGAEAAAFVRTRAELAAPDVEIVMLPVLWHDEGFTPPREHGFTLAPVVLRPASRGSVTLGSSDPLAPPVIRTDLLSDPEGRDLDTLVRGVRVARRIAAAPPMAELSAGELRPGGRAASDDDLRAFVRGDAQTIWHPVGTCRMGTDAEAVVDPALRVRGVEGVRVVDASVIPTLVRGHPNAATIMIAERAAELIREGAPARVAVPSIFGADEGIPAS